jgi:hypothetical protein
MEHRTNDNLILEKLDGIQKLNTEKFSNIEKLLENERENHKDHDKRIMVIELWQSNTVGKITVISIFIGIIMTSIASWVVGHFK